jgi:hypothetical protein
VRDWPYIYYFAHRFESSPIREEPKVKSDKPLQLRDKLYTKKSKAQTTIEFESLKSNRLGMEVRYLGIEMRYINPNGDLDENTYIVLDEKQKAKLLKWLQEN